MISFTSSSKVRVVTTSRGRKGFDPEGTWGEDVSMAFVMFSLNLCGVYVFALKLFVNLYTYFCTFSSM